MIKRFWRSDPWPGPFVWDERETFGGLWVFGCYTGNRLADLRTGGKKVTG